MTKESSERKPNANWERSKSVQRNEVGWFGSGDGVERVMIVTVELC